MDDHISKTVEFYNSAASDYAKQASVHVPEIERNNFCKQLSQNAKILDAGCGSGRDVLFFVNQGFDVTGIDLSDKLLEIAKNNGKRAKFVKQDIRKPVFPENSFDGIWCCASLLHLNYHEAKKTLSNFYKILKPNGLLVLIVKEGFGECIESLGKLPHQNRYTTFFQEEELKKIVCGAGFKVDNIYVFDEKIRYNFDRGINWIVCFARKI